MANAMKQAYMRGSKHAATGEKELRRTTIQESDNGGFIVECSYETKRKEGKGDNMPTCGTMYDETKEVFKDWDAAAAHLDDLYGDDEDDEES